MKKYIYMNYLADWTQKVKRTKSGVPLHKIQDLEENLKIVFPKSYKEFLELSGYNFIPLLISHDFDYIIETDVNKKALQMLKEANIVLDSPFWAFGASGDVFFFFYLDKNEDPSVYALDFDHTDELQDDYLYKISDSFSTFIKDCCLKYDPKNYKANW